MLAPTRLTPPEAPEAAGSADPDELEDLRRRVADVPGSAELPAGSPLPRNLLRTCQEEFEATAWLDCSLRTPENFLGELGEQLGLVLDGPMEMNLETLARHLEDRRVLLAFENFELRQLIERLTSNRTSLVTTSLRGDVSPNPAAVVRDLRTWQSDAARARIALAHANAAFEQVLATNWEMARDIGRLASLMTQRYGRNVEAYCWLERMEQEAVRRHDRELAFESARQRAWIAEAWGRTGDFPRLVSPEPKQLRLFA